MRNNETLREKAYRLWRRARLPRFLNRFGPKRTPGWIVYLCHLEYATHAPAWRRVAGFMHDYHGKDRHWTTWHKAISTWPARVWTALATASVADKCETAAIDGTGLSRSNPSQHYQKKTIHDVKRTQPMQCVLLIDIEHRKFLAWRYRAKPRGEKCDVPYLIEHSPTLPEVVLMDKGFDSNPLHQWLREHGIWSIAPVRKGCKRGQYRKQLRDCFDWSLYWQRNIIECMISAIKRLFGGHLRACTAHMQRAEIYTRLIAYNIGAPPTTTFY